MPDNIFTAPTLSETAGQLAASLPQGRAWEAKGVEGSNMRALINSTAVPHNMVQQLIQLMDEQFRISGTYDLLEEWEDSVGIPDECLAASDTIALRRQAVIDRLRKIPLVTLEDIQDYVNALYPDVTMVLIPGKEYYTFEYGLELPLLGDVCEKFILVVQIPVSGESFEYDFEVPLIGGPDTDKIRCLLEKIVPAEVYVIIEYVGAV